MPTPVGYVPSMNPSFPFDPDLHDPGSPAGGGRCSWHGTDGAGGAGRDGCDEEPVVSFRDRDGHWQSGCQRALEDLVDSGEIQPLGQGA
jgi:hypothetical protein